MKFLLDENLPKNLKFEFGELHQAFTVRDMNGKERKTVSFLD